MNQTDIDIAAMEERAAELRDAEKGYIYETHDSTGSPYKRTETCEACGGPLKTPVLSLMLAGAAALLIGMGLSRVWRASQADPIPGLYVPGDDEPQNPMAPSGGVEPKMPLPGPEKPRVR